MSFTLNFNGTILFTEAEFTLFNPILPPNVMAFSSDTGNIKIGDGETAWFDLPSLGGNVEQTIGGKIISSDHPSTNSLMYLCGATNQWRFRTWGCSDTESNWNNSGNETTIFGTYTLLVELDDVTNIPTGRIKIGDGSTQFFELPWMGDLTVEDIVHGEGISWDAFNSEWVHTNFASIDDITYEWLDVNGDVGTSSGQLAIGNHTHAHNNTTSIQGGNGSTEYYHLTFDAYTTFASVDDITFEALSANGDVGTSAGQLSEGDHLHVHNDLDYLQGGNGINEYYHIAFDTYTNVATIGDILTLAATLPEVWEVGKYLKSTIDEGIFEWEEGGGGALELLGTKGDLIVYDGVEWIVLSPGPIGTVLVSNGPGEFPSWEYIGV